MAAPLVRAVRESRSRIAAVDRFAKTTAFGTWTERASRVAVTHENG
jgi:hypothetical protein